MTHSPPLPNYDTTRLPDGYDRARDHGPEFLDLWMRTITAAMRGRRSVETILDLGCGTGRFSHALADTFAALVIGIDPSTRMLGQARARPQHARVRYVAARGERVPLPDQSVDLTFISMVFHHFTAPAHVANECRRVLRADGIVFLRAGSRDRVDAYPYVPFLPTSLPLLRETLPSCLHMREVFEAAGFQTIAQGLLVQQIAATHAHYAGKLEAGGDSVLARLDPRDFEEGLHRLRAHARRIDPLPVTEPIDYFVFA